MTSYYKPWYYTASHMIFGLVAVWYPIIGILVIIYQFGQLFFNIRTFPIEGVIKEGNSIEHTLKKLSEFGFGYIIGMLIKSQND